MKCTVAARCKNEATGVLVHKAIANRKEYRQPCCTECAGRVGSAKTEALRELQRVMGVPSGSLLDQPGMETRNYKFIPNN